MPANADFPPTVASELLAACASATPPGTGELLRGRLMQRSLQALLDRVHGSRTALPHLAALEVALIHQGADAVAEISQKVLSKIHVQLRILPLDPADGPIQDLVALVQRHMRVRARTQETHQLSPHDPQSTVVITEGSESDFMNALADARGRH